MDDNLRGIVIITKVQPDAVRYVYLKYVLQLLSCQN